MCVGMDAKENTAELHCGSSCKTCSCPGWVNQGRNGSLGQPPVKFAPGFKATYFLGSIIGIHTVPYIKNEFLLWENLLLRTLLSSHWSEEGVELGRCHWVRVADVSQCVSRGRLVCEIELHLSVLWNSVHNSPMLLLSGSGKWREPWDFLSYFCPIFGTSGLKEMKAFSLRTF